MSITRTSFTWGVPVPWDSGHVFYVWYDALINYLTVAGYGHDEAVFEARWGAAHHLIGKDILQFHCVWWPAMCMAAGIEPPDGDLRPRLLADGRAEAGQDHDAAGVAGEGDEATPVRIGDVSPLALADDFGVDPLRYHLLREVPLGGDGDFSYEGIVARYNSDLANNLGNLVSRVTTVVHSKCGGIGPACAAQSAAGLRRVRRVGAGHGGVGALGAPRGARGDVAPHRRRQRGARGVRTLEDGPGTRGRGRPRGRARGAAHRGRARSRRRCHRVAAEVWRRIGVPGDPGTARLPEAASMGRLHRGPEVVKGDPLFPRRKA